MSTNPWPDFETTDRKTVRNILLDLGSGVSQKTGDRIRFQIDTSIDPAGQFRHLCYLNLVPIQYAYPFMTVIHPKAMYPVTIISDDYPQPLILLNEADLIVGLTSTFSSATTKLTVQQLLEAIS